MVEQTVDCKTLKGALAYAFNLVEKYNRNFRESAEPLEGSIWYNKRKDVDVGYIIGFQAGTVSKGNFVQCRLDCDIKNVPHINVKLGDNQTGATYFLKFQGFQNSSNLDMMHRHMETLNSKSGKEIVKRLEDMAQ